ncbi:Uncharacterised protein [Mycobacteroides abscessus subsp. abscessus]|nr:Uncharacterised protein [Mycobacteroides abscessus subsp. abscessus]
MEAECSRSFLHNARVVGRLVHRFVRGVSLASIGDAVFGVFSVFGVFGVFGAFDVFGVGCCLGFCGVLTTVG